MPFKSQAQRRFMHAKHPEIAERWEAHTPKGKRLPARKPTKGRALTGKR
jgi:hypothetical protein